MTENDIRELVDMKKRAMILSLIDGIAKHTARTRRIVELDGEVDFFDKSLNEACERWYDHYRDMDVAGLQEEVLIERILG